jgi:hypothetical protein
MLPRSCITVVLELLLKQCVLPARNSLCLWHLTSRIMLIVYIG